MVIGSSASADAQVVCCGLVVFSRWSFTGDGPAFDYVSLPSDSLIPYLTAKALTDLRGSLFSLSAQVQAAMWRMFLAAFAVLAVVGKYSQLVV